MSMMRHTKYMELQGGFTGWDELILIALINLKDNNFFRSFVLPFG